MFVFSILLFYLMFLDKYYCWINVYVEFYCCRCSWLSQHLRLYILSANLKPTSVCSVAVLWELHMNTLPSSVRDRNPEGILLWRDTRCPLLFHLAHNTAGQSLSNDSSCTFLFCCCICVMSLTYPGFYFCYLWFNSFSHPLGSFFHLIF